MSKYRILRIQSRICIGGPALNTIYLCSSMNPEQYESLLVSGKLLDDEKSIETFAKDKGVNIHIIDQMGRSFSLLNDIRTFFKLIKLIRHYKPHIVHTHTAKAGALGRLAAFWCRVPIRIHTFHGHVFTGYFNSIISTFIIWIERSLARLTHRIIAISPRQQHDLVTRFRIVPQDKCTIIRLGFDLEKLKQGDANIFCKRWNLSPQTKIAAIIARIVPIKNHKLLLNAIAHWRTLNPQATPDDIRFLIIGDGKGRQNLETHSQKLGITDFCLFTGWQTDMANIYAALSLNILVSKNEGTPVSLIEGLSVGVPVLSTDVGGIRDFTDDSCATIVPPSISPIELGQTVHDIFSITQEQKTVSSQKQNEIQEMFSYKRLAKEMEELYQNLIKKIPPTF